MPSMLEQAIVDAAALREAALKNAEHAIIEKYAPEIKEAVRSILEEEPEMGRQGSPVRHNGKIGRVTVESDQGQVGIQYSGETAQTFLVNESELEFISEEDVLQEEEMMASGVTSVNPAGSDMNIPLGAAEGEKMCPCPDEDDSVQFTFSIDDFKELSDSQPNTPEEDKMSLPLEESVEAEPTNEEKQLDELLDMLSEMEEEGLLEVEAAEEDTVMEELVVDMAGVQKDGTFNTNEASLQYQEEMELAKEEATKSKEDKEKAEKENEKLKESIKKLKSENQVFENTIYKLSQKMKETLLSNAKLLYSNRVLSDASLNERQKSKIVEAITKSRSPEEAKNLHEALKTTVGTTKKDGPKSLRESVERRSNLSSILPRRKKENKQDNQFSERMRRLAGID